MNPFSQYKQLTASALKKELEELSAIRSSYAIQPTPITNTCVHNNESILPKEVSSNSGEQFNSAGTVAPFLEQSSKKDEVYDDKKKTNESNKKINEKVEQHTFIPSQSSSINILLSEHNSSSRTQDERVEQTKPIYAGDIEDSTPPPNGTFQVLEFETSTELMSFFMPDVNSGTTVLHSWQKQANNDLSLAKPTSKKPYKFCLCACNGSGKDAFVIAPFAVWFCCTKIKSRCIITSSSGTQLTAQTESYIRSLCIKINEYMTLNFGGPIFKINQRYIKCLISGSEIRLFATDEEGKAEGYHPLEPDTEMCIIVNEGKSVEEKIYRALRRCTGYNYWIDVSSPGQPLGDFHTHFVHWPNTLRVDYTLCPHHSDEERLEDLVSLGEANAYYRSKWLAYFTSLDSSSVLPHELVESIRELSRTGVIASKGQTKRTGIDLAGGGDENSVKCLKGNSIFKALHFKEKDTTLAAKRIDAFLTLECGLSKDNDNIFADDGGIGRAIIDMLSNTYGWKIKRIMNQSPASDKKRYANRGAELWYGAKEILESQLFLLNIQDDKFYKQLSNRFYKTLPSGKIGLESKKEAKAHGRPSPDRADAFVLALTGCKSEDFSGDKIAEEPKKDKPKIFVSSSSEAIEAWHEARQDREYNNFNGGGTKVKFHNSLNTLINNQRN